MVALTERAASKVKEIIEAQAPRPAVALAKTWLEQHPGMSKRQFAIRLSARIREMGYSRSHDTLQPILGGWKKKTRRFVYRAMLIECPSVKCLTKSCVYPAGREGVVPSLSVAEVRPSPFQERIATGMNGEGDAGESGTPKSKRR